MQEENDEQDSGDPLKKLYTNHHQQWCCYRQLFYHFKRLNAIFNATSLLIMALGFIIGPVLQNIILTASLAAFGTFIKGWNEFKKYALKMDMTRFAYTTHAKTLSELRTHAHHLPPGELELFLIKQQTLEDIIIDFAPSIPDAYRQHYQRYFPEDDKRNRNWSFNTYLTSPCPKQEEEEEENNEAVS